MGLDDFELEPSSAEPDEWDPEDDLHDPEADGLTIPQVSTDEADVDPEIARTFWIVVLIVNAAVLFVSVGPMLWVFRGRAREGAALVLGGLVLFALAYRRYRRFTNEAPPERDAPDDDVPAAERTSGTTERSARETDDTGEATPTNGSTGDATPDPTDEESP